MPDPAAVADFLSAPPEPVEGGAVRLDLDAAVKDTLLPPPVEEVPRTEIPVDPAYSSGAPTQASVLLWTMKLPEIGDVKVEDFEKVLYLKAILHDDPVRLTIKLPMGFSAEIQSRSTLSCDTIFAALDLDKEHKVIQDMGNYATRLQYYSAMTQVCRIGEKDFPVFEADYNLTLFANAEKLRSAEPAAIGRMNGTRWDCLLTTLRIFEAKLKLCADAGANGDFWKPVS